jgi:hypothetical protein
MCAQGICQEGWCDDGIETEWVCTAPEVNFANENAKALLATLGMGTASSGALEPMEIAGILEICEQALQETATAFEIRAPMLRGRQEIPRGRGPRVLVFESSDEDAKRRIRDLIPVLRFAHENGVGILWA